MKNPYPLSSLRPQVLNQTDRTLPTSGMGDLILAANNVIKCRYHQMSSIVIHTSSEDVCKVRSATVGVSPSMVGVGSATVGVRPLMVGVKPAGLGVSNFDGGYRVGNR